MTRTRLSRPRRGLTLVDMLIALTILAVILSAVYATFFYQEQGRRAADKSREIYGQGLVVMQRISRDIAGAWLPVAAGGQTGMVFRFEAGPSSLNCITTAAMLTAQTIGPELTEVGYRTEESEDGKISLVRRQDNTVDDDPASGGNEIILSRDLAALELFYIGLDELEQTSVEALTLNQLPVAVRIRLVLKDEAGDEHAFQSIVKLPVRLGVVKRLKTGTGILPF